MSTEVRDPVTGAKQSYIHGDGLYSAITGRKIGTIVGGSGGGGSSGGGMTAVDMSQWEIEWGLVENVPLEGGKYYYYEEINMGLSIASVEQTLEEIIVQFYFNGGSVEFPDTLQWIGTPSFESGKTYVISIINNIAVAGVIE